MKKVTLIYGLIAGAIVAAIMFITMPLWETGVLNFDNGELLGYTSMVIALSMVFFGIKSYRDNYAQGIISFWQGCKIGLLITLIASLMYATAWEVNFRTMSGDFMEQMEDHQMKGIRASGVSEESIQKSEQEMAGFMDMYKNNFFIRFGITLLEIFPVGFLITLLSAGLLRKKEFLPATQAVR